MKKCYRCLCEKSIDMFGKDSARSDGKNPACKKCVNELSALYRAANPEKRKSICAAYRSTNREKCRASYKAWYEKDIIATRKAKRAYDAENIEQARARRAKWRSENKAKIAQIKIERTNATGAHSGEDIKRIFLLQRGKCAYCYGQITKHKYHVDHIVPIKLGGTNDAFNIQLLCPACNLSKGAKHPILFAQESGRLL